MAMESLSSFKLEDCRQSWRRDLNDTTCVLNWEGLAKQLASLGAKLIISSRNEADLNRVRTELKGKCAPDEVKILPLELTSGEDSLREVLEKAKSFFLDSVDYMIHNAAFERPGISVPALFYGIMIHEKPNVWMQHNFQFATLVPNRLTLN